MTFAGILFFHRIDFALLQGFFIIYFPMDIDKLNLGGFARSRCALQKTNLNKTDDRMAWDSTDEICIKVFAKEE